MDKEFHFFAYIDSIFDQFYLKSFVPYFFFFLFFHKESSSKFLHFEFCISRLYYCMIEEDMRKFVRLNT